MLAKSSKILHKVLTVHNISPLIKTLYQKSLLGLLVTIPKAHNKLLIFRSPKPNQRPSRRTQNKIPNNASKVSNAQNKFPISRSPKSPKTNRKASRKSHNKVTNDAPKAYKATKSLNKFVTTSSLTKLLSRFTDVEGLTKAQIFIRLARSGNVEKNPGPDDISLRVMTYNVRGLNDERKLRHLVNKIYKEDKGKSCDSIVCLQETYVMNVGKLPYLWRGNLHLTPGTGSSCGCLILTSPHLNIVHASDIENRAQVVVCQRASDARPTYIAANIYAPNCNNLGKIEFFDKVFNEILELSERFNCQNLVVMGDFNLILKQSECKNRLFTAQEKRVANFVKDQIRALGLTDCWEREAKFTWRRPNSDTFSAIDRILFSTDTLKVNSTQVNWSYGFSDHAAVCSNFSFKGKTSLPKSKITRLDPTLAKDPRYSSLVEQGFKEMIDTMPQHWNPHLKLEFAKVCIRTVVEKVQADRKIGEVGEEDLINEELDLAIDKLVKCEGGSSADLIEHVEELRLRNHVLVEQRGARLAEKLGTKWYNEGEKSSRYFMRLLNRALPDNFEVLQDESGEIINDPKEIEEVIVKFYKDLYEEHEPVVENDDHEFFNHINPISDEDDDFVSSPLSTHELLKTLGTCSDSAPGPDGIPYSIIRLLWSTFGELLKNAWQYSIETRSLPISHKTSFLKLIPKAGKDLTKLTNWRPITLSNCDHKLITKSYAKRLCDKVASKIGGCQTAYLKNRLINDNIRAMISTINLANMEDNLNGLIVSLDAKKAFDSVDHGYIEQCLKRFGCRSFVPIFRTLYRDLKTDIIINGRIVPGFKVNRGVKQGDALSCILFIMSIEPLLRNIETNPAIEILCSETLNMNLPKVYAYADDISCLMVDSVGSIQALFQEYERLSNKSGLELNADKTELMKIGNNEESEYNVIYRGQNHLLKSQVEIKINGIIFQRSQDVMKTRNVEEAIRKMDKHFRSWSRRSLSTVGKILIAKTFGISQAIYLMQSIRLDDVHLKQINALLYKFIWNRHYLSAKAPERIKREIVTNPIKHGGYGMIDVEELDGSLKIKALSRMLRTEHPFIKILKNKLNMNSYFNPAIETEPNIDPVTDKALELLKLDRNGLWEDARVNQDRKILAAIRGTELKSVMNRRGLGSINYFRLWVRGLRLVGQLSRAELDSISVHIAPTKLDKLRRAIEVNTGPNAPDFGETYYTGSLHKPLHLFTSKEIRTSRCNKQPIQEFKIGLRLTVNESLSWGLRLSKLSSTRHKNTLLKAVHGDVYTKDKLFRFGLRDSDLCPRCDQKEDLEHKLLTCPYAHRIWTRAIPYIEKLNTQQDPNATRLCLALGATKDTSLAALTLSAELLQVILALKDEQTYIIHPRIIVERAIKNLSRKEAKEGIKKLFIELVSEIENI